MRRDVVVEQALWFYGVIVALAIEQALVRSVPHLIYAPFDDRKQMLPELFRLLMFLTVVVRFYWGAVQFLYTTYLKPAVSPDRVFAWDFLPGLIHFLGFFFWSFTLPIHARDGIPAPPQWLYLILLWCILAYDLFWIALTFRNPSRMAKMWTAVNVITVLISALLFVVLKYPLNWNFADAEVVALVVVLFFSIMDLVELSTGRDWYARQLARLLPDALVSQPKNPPNDPPAAGNG